MALVVFLRGVNVGRHKRFMPATLAKDLAVYDVVNIGAAGTFVVRAPVPQAALLAAIRTRLAFQADIMIVKERKLVEFAASAPFGRRPPAANEQRFLSVLLTRSRAVPPLPVIYPPNNRWQVKIVAASGRLVASVWRRQPGTPIYPNAVLERGFGVATTRNWNTVETICDILRT
jgi:uncharacterized protein (DUF1697 family)